MRKLRTAEAELETKQSQAARQTANAKKLEEQLAEITAGVLPCGDLCPWVSTRFE